MPWTHRQTPSLLPGSQGQPPSPPPGHCQGPVPPPERARGGGTSMYSPDTPGGPLLAASGPQGPWGPSQCARGSLGGWERAQGDTTRMPTHTALD